MGIEQFDILKIIWQSGPVVKSVLFLLFFASILSWAIIFKKIVQLKRVDKDNRKFMKSYQASSSLKEVMESATKGSFSSYQIMFIRGYDELVKIKKNLGKDNRKNLGNHFQNFGLGMIERALKKGSNECNIKLEQLLSVLASIGSISPFIGLFGTVWGIINSFTGLAGGGATLDAVAPGIAEALVATAIGLAAAIPAVWFYNYFSHINGRLGIEMENFTQEFLNVVERSLILSDK